MTDAIEPWVDEEIHRKQLLAHELALRQARLHSIDLSRLQASGSAQPHAVAHSNAAIHHSIVNSHHVDVDA